jgi:PAS domain S-box-containing protein
MGRSLGEKDRFRVAVEAAPSGMVLVDRAGRIVLVNALAEKLFGYSRDELVGQRIEMLVPERFRGKHPGFRSDYAVQPRARPMGAGRDLFALRKDGTEIPVEIGLSPLTIDQRAMVLSAVVDLTERKRGEEAREILIRELRHRCNNLLTVIQAIARKSFSGSGSLDEERTTFEERLLALARVNRQLTESNWSALSLSKIVRSALEPFAAQTDIDGANVTVNAKLAQDFSLALHELATNAVKHGALSRPTGSVSVAWTITGTGNERMLKFQWRERGGPPVVAPSRYGFGTSLLKTTFREVRFDYAPTGLSCEIDVSLGNDWLDENRNRALGSGM